MRWLVFGLVLMVPVPHLWAHSGDTLDVPYGTRPAIEGIVSPGEWDDAVTVTANLPDGPATIYLKENPDTLYLAVNLPDVTYDDFDNCTPYFDRDHNAGSAPQTDDFGMGTHRSGMIVEFAGTGSGWNIVPQTGWNCAISSDSIGWQVECWVSYGKLGLTPGTSDTLGFACLLGDLGNGAGVWPPVASRQVPNTWADLLSSDNWGAPDTLPPSVVVVVPNGGEAWMVGEEDTIRWTAYDPSGVDSVGIYYSTDAGSNWLVVARGEPNDSAYLWTVPNTPSDSCVVRIVAWDPNLNSGEDESDSLFSIYRTGVGETSESQSPMAGLQLFQNFPNPFTRDTQIAYSVLPVAETGDAISLRVYDLAGGLVRSLVNGFREAGTHTVPWDGEDESGRKVGSGVYFLRLANDREVLIGKAVVVR